MTWLLLFRVLTTIAVTSRRAKPLPRRGTKHQNPGNKGVVQIVWYQYPG